jgi:hypothetical protein
MSRAPGHRRRRTAWWRVRVSLLFAGVLGICALAVSTAQAQSSWSLEQPEPPPPPAGVAKATGPEGLGRVGDIEFWAPNDGALITAGNGKAIPSGVWIYNGAGWRELSTECGASDGRIAWAGPNEFWTISDGRPGQADVDGNAPPLEDDTLCRFADGKIVESFAAPAFEADSYQPMDAAACLSSEDCWFAGAQLPPQSTEIGAFQLHWNGSSLSESPYTGEGHEIKDFGAFNGELFESVRLLEDDPVSKTEASPPALHVLNPESSAGWQPEGEVDQHEYDEAVGERPWALGYLHLSGESSGLWAATGQQTEGFLGEPPKPTEEQQLTVLRYTTEAGGTWTQLVGPDTSTSEASQFLGKTVAAIAAEPGQQAAWLGLQQVSQAAQNEGASPPPVNPEVQRISADGAVSEPETLTTSDAVTGAVAHITCPEAGDCWMVTTEGWLFHLAPEGEPTLPVDSESEFTELITERPPDQGLPQTEPDSLPEDDSGLSGEAPVVPAIPKVSKTEEELRVPVALVSHIHSRLVHGTTLELRFHLAVKARIQLLARRKHRVVAKSTTHVFAAGNRELLLALNRKAWPTELHLVDHALAPLPTVSTRSAGSEIVTTSLAFPSRLLASGTGLIP